MALWARFMGGMAAWPSPKQDVARRPEHLLAAFTRTHDLLIQSWRRFASVPPSAATAEPVRLLLDRLAAILHDESGTPGAHPCSSAAISFHLPASVCEIGLVAEDAGVMHAAVATFNALLDTEEDMVGNAGFAQSLVKLAKGVTASAATVHAGSSIVSDVVELLFGVATKIRLQPDILPVWFKERGRDVGRPDDATHRGRPNTAAGSTARQDQDFPLFYALLQYVHYESPIGDFARTGILYIIESAARSHDLECWLVECDLATLMASGLGALYSQLSRKLTVSLPTDQLPSVLAMSDVAETASKANAQTSGSLEYRTNMETFLSYLMFWQDVLDHCPSIDVQSTLLDHFQVLFVQQLLYPSLLESSDVDGGSSVAALTYLRRILECLHHPRLAHLLLRYLLALPDRALDEGGAGNEMPRVAKRRRTMDMLIQATTGKEGPSPTLFSLGDLVLASVSSQDPQTVTAALLLVAVLLWRYHLYTPACVVRTAPASDTRSRRSLGAHDKELDNLFALAASIDDSDDLDMTYEALLFDTKNALELHPCFMPSQRGRSRTQTEFPPLEEGPGMPLVHSLIPEDPFLDRLVTLLESFYANSVDANLSLTEAIIALASCRHTRLEGWLLVDPTKYRFDDAATMGGPAVNGALSASTTKGRDPDRDGLLAESARVHAITRGSQPPTWSAEDHPSLMTALQRLVDELETYRQRIPVLDQLVSERKRAFQLNDRLETVSKSTAAPLPMTPVRASATSAAPHADEALSPIGLLSRRLFGGGSNRSSRSTSPRGRPQTLQPGSPPSAHPEPRHMPSMPAAGPRTMSPSPLRDGAWATGSRQHARAPVPLADSLRRQVAMKQTGTTVPEDVAAPDSADSAAHSNGSDINASGIERSTALAQRIQVGTESVSVNHLLTNVVLLHDFVLELAALVQVRGSLFDDIRFS
ncbi:MAG: hypothetical protein M1826_002787 [Phylliscum demangeonii]|nr:MAG: hypothetical protein M1826_002787 [Phylliscum demangeonii]